MIFKNLKLEQIKPAIENAKEAGLLVHTFWMVGFPGETREEMEESMAFAAETGADSFSVGILTPLPGTPIYRHTVREKLWWDVDRGMKDVMFRNSLIKADGFDSPEEFEGWVTDQTNTLNRLLDERDPERAALVKRGRGARHLTDSDDWEVRQML